MKLSTISLLANIATFLILPIGLVLMILWTVKIFPRLRKHVENGRHLSLHLASVKTLFFMAPGIIVFLFFTVPMFYFLHLKKQENYCITVIKVNHLKKDDSFLNKECGSLDKDELWQKSLDTTAQQ